MRSIITLPSSGSGWWHSSCERCSTNRPPLACHTLMALLSLPSTQGADEGDRAFGSANGGITCKEFFRLRPGSHWRILTMLAEQMRGRRWQSSAVCWKESAGGRWMHGEVCDLEPGKTTEA